MIHDVGSDFKVPLPILSKRSEDWPKWSARFGAYAELAGLSTVLEVAEAQTAPISMVGAPPEAIRVEKIANAVMLSKSEGKAYQHCSSHTQRSGSSSVESPTRGTCWVIWSATWKHGT